MTLEQLVPTLDLCQQLKAAGFPQDTGLRWSMQHEPHIPDVEPMWIPVAFNEPILCAAPTAEEILRALPVRTEIGERWGTLESYVSTMNDFSFYVGWQAHHSPTEKEAPWYGANKLSEAAAQAYLWWKKGVAG